MLLATAQIDNLKLLVKQQKALLETKDAAHKAQLESCTCHCHCGVRVSASRPKITPTKPPKRLLQYPGPATRANP
jgi:hypothetical protein